MTYIDEEFMDIHPVVARRLAFFNGDPGDQAILHGVRGGP
jgi:hypothetical protein